MSKNYGLADVETTAYEPNPDPESGIKFAKLTARLGCEEMRLNTSTVPPGEEGPYHRHESQEEVYVLLNGTGQVNIDGELVDVSEGDIVRVPAALPRKLVNNSTEQQQWLMIGAPPVGTVDDQGEAILIEE